MNSETALLNNFEEDEKDIGDYFNLLRRRKGLITLVFIVILSIALAFAFGLPPIYKSTGTILIEQQEVPQDFVRTLVTSYAEQRIQVISQKVLSSKKLAELINKYNLYPEEREIYPIESVISEMRENISLDMVSADVVDPRSGQARTANIAFTLSFESKSPKLAQSVANEIVTLFLNENIKNRTETAIEASAFLSAEGEKLRTTIAELESRLAQFKEENSESLPELTDLNTQMMNRTEQEILEVKRQIIALNERKIYLAAELAQQPETIDEQRYNPAYDLQRQKFELELQKHNYEIQRRARIGAEPDTRLEALQTEYLAASSKYSATHPDVQRLKREIDSLKTEVGVSSGDTTVLDTRIAGLQQQLSTARDRYSADHPDVKRFQRELADLESQRADQVVDFSKTGASDFPSYSVTQPQFLIKTRPNPAHVQLKAQLDAADTELVSLNAKIDELESRYRDYESRLMRTPQVEREYRDLVRDFDTATEKYREITSKQLEAQLAQSLESERKGERFTLIEPPIMPEEPFKPNRLAITFLGLVFSFAGGLGSAFLVDALNDTVRGRTDVKKIMGEPPLSVIPYIETFQDRRKKYLQRVLIILGVILMASAALVLIHIYYMPLDVLWFKSLRKFGF